MPNELVIVHFHHLQLSLHRNLLDNAKLNYRTIIWHQMSKENTYLNKKTYGVKN